MTATKPKKRGLNPKQIDKHMKMLRRFVEVYCRKNHEAAGSEPCAECGELLEYARARLEKCPYDPKPKCKDCPSHCYKPEYRQRIREIMRFSGMHFVKRGRLDWLVRYFLTEGPPSRRERQPVSDETAQRNPEREETQ